MLVSRMLEEMQRESLDLRVVIKRAADTMRELIAEAE